VDPIGVIQGSAQFDNGGLASDGFGGSDIRSRRLPLQRRSCCR
jgi:hypothetical protein